MRINDGKSIEYLCREMVRKMEKKVLMREMVISSKRLSEDGAMFKLVKCVPTRHISEFSRTKLWELCR